MPAPGPKKIYGTPEKKNWIGRILGLLFIMGAIGGIAWMVAHNPKQKKLVCRHVGPVGPTSFGTCEEADD